MKELREFRSTMGSSLDDFITSLASGRWTFSTPTLTRTIDVTVASTKGRGRPSLMALNGHLLEEMTPLISSGLTPTQAAGSLADRAVGASREASQRWLQRKWCALQGE
jgi:hypothetical protein